MLSHPLLPLALPLCPLSRLRRAGGGAGPDSGRLGAGWPGLRPGVGGRGAAEGSADAAMCGGGALLPTVGWTPDQQNCAGIAGGRVKNERRRRKVGECDKERGGARGGEKEGSA